MDNTTAMTTVGEPVIVQVTEEHHIAQARQTARALAEAIGFRPRETLCVATCVSELASNLFFHATRDGTITLVAVKRDGESGIEVISEDGGPGILDVKLAMQDGSSTTGGLGSGLPGAERLMDEFEIMSAVGVGTRIVARKWQQCK